VATLAQTICGWLDAGQYPPNYAQLPQTITIEDGILNGVVDALTRSIQEKRERGAGIGLWDESPPKLQLGTIEYGEEASIVTASVKTPLGSFPVGTFHTHPDGGGFSAPSPADIWSLAKSKTDVFELVAAQGWFYLLIRTADATIPQEFGRLDRDVQGAARTAISNAELMIRREMTQVGLPPEIHPDVPKQIGYNWALIELLKKWKLGFYSSPSAVLIKRA
jgi:hypothetical protein